ncbi:MAG: hypothetical protein WC391_03145 [Methanoregula sp.]|jgi:hypothetical protein
MFNYLICRILLVLSCIALASLALPLVSADSLNPTVTTVYFEKDGVPYQESVFFTVNCYGYRCDNYDCSAPKMIAGSAAYVPEIIFSYSATCPGYGCVIYEPFYLNYRHVDRCDLTGVTRNSSFLISHFADTPVPDCVNFQQFEIGRGYDEYYNGTPEYDECVNKTYRESEICGQYLAGCSPSTDTDCGNWIIDDRYVKKTPAYRSCMDTVDKKRNKCFAYLKKVDTDSMIMWKNTVSGQEEPAMRTCEQHFIIPPDGNVSLSPSKKPDINQSEPVQSPCTCNNPIEYAWCTLLNFFGIAC